MGKKFDLGTILTVTTGKLLTPDIDNLYKILDYMTGEELFTHELPEYSRMCKPYILERYPNLANVDVSEVNKDNYKEFLDKQVSIYGEYLEVPKAKDVKRIDDPISSWARITSELKKEK